MKDRLIYALSDALEMEANIIRPEDHFRDYENYSSLTELSVIAMLDSEFGIEIEMKEFNNYMTVEDLTQLVVDKSTKK